MSSSGQAVNVSLHRKGKKTPRDDLSVEKLGEFVYEGVDKFYCTHIPVESLKELPEHYMYAFGLVAYLLSFVLFFIFIYGSYTSAVSQPFMSLQGGSLCQPVYNSVTSTFQADTNGIWFGQANYSYVQSVFSIELNMFTGTLQQFQDLMDEIYAETLALATLGLKHNLAINTIYWMSYLGSFQAGNSLVRFDYSGTPSVVYALKYSHSQVSSVSSDCPLDSLTSYDQANAKISSMYNYSEFSLSPQCTASVDPYALGFVKTIDGNDLTFEFDVNSFQLAMAVNLGAIPLNLLIEIPHSNISFAYKSITFHMASFYDFRTPTMTAIFCVSGIDGLPSDVQDSILSDLTATSLCFVQVGDLFGLPVFNHYGSDAVQPVYCDCADGTGYSLTCQEFNFISGLLFYNIPVEKAITTEQSLHQVLALELGALVILLNNTKSYLALNRAAYNASFASSYSVNSKVNPILYDSSVINNPVWRKDAYSFCEISNPYYGTKYPDGTFASQNLSCSLITFSTSDPLYKTVSEYKYQLFPGSCSNSFSIDRDLWDGLASNPPVSFSQPYFECTYGQGVALLNAVGIAQGNVQVVLPLLVFVSLPLLYIFLKAVGQVPPREEYAQREKEDVIESWAVQLLRLRDGKTRGLKARGVLMALGNELIKAAKEEGGYPDSDDSDDEDDESRSSRMTAESVGEKKSRKDRQSAASSMSKAATQRKPISLQRHKLDIFTKHIRERESASAKDISRTKSSGTLMSRLSFNASASRQNAHALSTAYGMWSKKPAGDRASDSSINSEFAMERSGVLAMIAMGAKDTDVQVLNGAAMNPDIEVPKGVVPKMNFIESDAVLEMLLTKLTEAMTNKPTKLTPSRETEAFTQAKECATKLRYADVNDLLSREDGSFFIKLSNALSLHCSIALGCEVRDVAVYYSDKIAYDIGGRLYTPTHLMEISTSGHM